jgi:carbamoyltransferase
VPTHILGISAFYHDSAAVVVRDGTIVAAAQEERFSRRKHDADFPMHAIEYCLSEAGITAGNLDYVGFYDKPITKFIRLLETYLAFAPSGFRSFKKAMPLWLKQKLHVPRLIRESLGPSFKGAIVFAEHHESHAASTFFPSPFERAAILTLDGVGEWATGTMGYGEGNRITLTHELRFPHSLGLLYSAFTYYLGFKVNEGEYKVMGLAPYGKPVYVDLILENLLDLKPDGSLRFDLSYFNYCQGLTMTSEKFHELFGAPPRRPDALLTGREMDLAASVQKVTEEVMLRASRHLHKQTGCENLVLAGGVALNCVGNGRIGREGPFKRIWVQPAAGDAGGALGTALFIWHQLLGKERLVSEEDSQRGSLLGPRYETGDICSFLDRTGAAYRKFEREEDLLDEVADLIADGKVIGWFQGRAEFGPRALGCRSIIGDARSATMQSIMNLKVKYRESFRPFAPCVLREHAPEWFEVPEGTDSPYMLFVAPVRKEKRVPVDDGSVGVQALSGIDLLKVRRSQVPAITHVDYSSRIQTVDRARHGRFRRLMERFYEKTGCPIIVNTSFNLGWDPIVGSPEDAYNTFMSSDIDALVLEDCLLSKAEQPSVRRVSESDGRRDPILEEVLICPACSGRLEPGSEADIACCECGRRFPVTDGVLQLFHPHDEFGSEEDVTQRVREFYEETPFPNYDDTDSIRSLIEKSRRHIYPRLLGEQIPFNSHVLEVGCGTGQLTNYLGIGCRTVVGADLCLNSLRLGETFRKSHGLDRARFIQMNLFKPSLRREFFDVVLCNGVLHHTSDPYAGFRSILELLKPGGHIVIGLYNSYGRLMMNLRQVIFRVGNGHFRNLDTHLRTAGLGEAKASAWFMDQYRHPHESKHTVDEVLGWFDESGVEFVNAVPKVRWQDSFSPHERLFESAKRGTRTDRLLRQLGTVVSGSREGGFFIMIGRKREEAQR